MRDWTKIADYISAQWPQMRENLLRMDELDRKMREAGIPVRPMSPMLQEAVRIAKNSPLSNSTKLTCKPE